MNTAISSALVGLFVWNPVAGNVAINTPVAHVELPTYTVAMTAYNAVPGQTDDTPHITSIGAYSNPEIIAARSQDLAEKLPYGTVIEVTAASSTVNCGYEVVKDQIGLRVIGDAMNARMRNKIDILFGENHTARARGATMNSARVLGRCGSVQIQVVGKIDTKNMPRNQQELRLAIGYLEKAEPQNIVVKK